MSAVRSKMQTLIKRIHQNFIVLARKLKYSLYCLQRPRKEEVFLLVQNCATLIKRPVEEFL